MSQPKLSRNETETHAYQGGGVDRNWYVWTEVPRVARLLAKRGYKRSPAGEFVLPPRAVTFRRRPNPASKPRSSSMNFRRKKV